LQAAGRNGFLAPYAAAVLAIALGIAIAFARFPGGYDWAYTVISKLASRRHNPDGAIWLCGGLLVAVLLLWRAVRPLGGRPGGERPGAALIALRAGLIGAGLLAIEGLFSVNLSSFIRKGHELLALLTLLALYGGVLGLYAGRIRRDRPFLWPALLVLLPLVAVGLSQLALYFDQRDLGWVDTSWRELGVPIWLSFAFWQWTAVALLGAGLGHLIATAGAPAPRPARAPAGRGLEGPG
jgi:hypothetical protein